MSESVERWIEDHPKTAAAIVMFVAGLLLYVMACGLVQARSSPQWAKLDPKISAWFAGLMQPDNPGATCCGEADAYESDIFEQQDGHYVAVITDGKNVIPNNTRIMIPDRKIKWDKGNPTGHGWVFLGTGDADGSLQVYCYVTPGGA